MTADRPTVDPRAAVYYERRTLENAIADTRTRIEEWNYEADAHGYCHERPDWMLILAAVDTKEAAAKALEDADDDPLTVALAGLNAKLAATVLEGAADELRDWRQNNATNFHTSHGLLTLEREWRARAAAVRQEETTDGV